MSEGSGCGRHRAFIYQHGGQVVQGELTDIVRVKWQRIRDDISVASVRIGPSLCCEVLDGTNVVLNELHIWRDDELVWCGIITRLEFEVEGADIFAEDMLWVAKRRALSVGHNYQYPPSGGGPFPALEFMDDLLREMTFFMPGDPWHMLDYIHPIPGPEDPMIAPQNNAWASTTWELFDKAAEDYGMDYTVVGRDVYYFDVHLAWTTLPRLEETHIAEGMRIVEYGNEFATRYIHTNNSGYAGIGIAPSPYPEMYGEFIDVIGGPSEQAARATDGTTLEPEAPTWEELVKWQETAMKHILELVPPKTSVLVPAGSTLMPSCPWNVNELIPGSWFEVLSNRLCRGLLEWHRLDEVTVEDSGENGETVSITTGSAPSERLEPL